MYILLNLSNTAARADSPNYNNITNTMQEPNLVLLDSHGVYIPQIYCEDADEHWANCVGVDYKDVQICQAGPEHEWYWEAWQSILDNASIVSDGVTWRLHQDGDLWEVPDGYEWPDA